MFKLEDIKFPYSCPFCNTVFTLKLEDKENVCPQCNAVINTSVQEDNLNFNVSFADEVEDGQH